jgi:hypothetical protein
MCFGYPRIDGWPSPASSPHLFTSCCAIFLEFRDVYPILSNGQVNSVLGSLVLSRLRILDCGHDDISSGRVPKLKQSQPPKTYNGDAPRTSTRTGRTTSSSTYS